MASKTYSFLDIQCAIEGPNGSFSLGSDAGVAEEGITFSFADDKATVMMGAGGQGMHSLHAAKNGTVTVRLLKTSPVNSLLQDMYNADTASSADYGQNTISLRNPVNGDSHTAADCGFRKFPDLVNGKVGQMLEWTFNSLAIDPILGTGTPSAL